MRGRRARQRLFLGISAFSLFSSHVSFTGLVILSPLPLSSHPVDVTYNTGCTWRVVYPHPIGTVVRVKVLATILVEASAAHCDDEIEYMLYDERGNSKEEQVKTCGRGNKELRLQTDLRYKSLEC